MKSARRAPRKIGNNEDETQQEPLIAVKRPTTKLKKPSHLRTSFAPPEDDLDGDSSLRAVYKPPLKRRVQESTGPDLPYRAGIPEDRPNYNADYLNELKLATPHTPANLSSTAIPEVSNTSQNIDIVSKFGDSALALSRDTSSLPSQAHIPSEAEIREKKERRRRLAREQDFISLDSGGEGVFHHASDSENEGQDPRSHSLIIPADEIDLKSKYGESRLVREDEDMAEGFEDFIEDEGKVTLGRKAAKEQDKLRRKEMEEQIRAAQHGYGYRAGASGSDEEDGEGENEVDEDEVRRNAAYEAAQTRKGTYVVGGGGIRDDRDKEAREQRRLQLPKTKPVPEFKVVVARFAEMVKHKEAAVEEKKRQLQRVEKEREEVSKEEERVKELLREAGDRFEKLRMETAGSVPVEGDPRHNGTNGESYIMAVETIESVAAASTPIGQVDSSDDEAPGGLGSLNTPRTFGGMAPPPKEEDEDDWY